MSLEIKKSKDIDDIYPEEQEYVWIEKDKKTIRCAFHLDTYCSPICAAFDQRGCKLFCQKNGIDNEFFIGYIND